MSVSDTRHSLPIARRLKAQLSSLTTDETSDLRLQTSPDAGVEAAAVKEPLLVRGAGGRTRSGLVSCSSTRTDRLRARRATATRPPLFLQARGRLASSGRGRNASAQNLGSAVSEYFSGAPSTSATLPRGARRVGAPPLHPHPSWCGPGPAIAAVGPAPDRDDLMRRPERQPVIAHQHISQFGQRGPAIRRPCLEPFRVELGGPHRGGRQVDRARGVDKHREHQGLQVVLGIHDIAERGVVHTRDNRLTLAQRPAADGAHMPRATGLRFCGMMLLLWTNRRRAADSRIRRRHRSRSWTIRPSAAARRPPPRFRADSRPSRCCVGFRRAREAEEVRGELAIDRESVPVIAHAPSGHWFVRSKALLSRAPSRSSCSIPPADSAHGGV